MDPLKISLKNKITSIALRYCKVKFAGLNRLGDKMYEAKNTDLLMSRYQKQSAFEVGARLLVPHVIKMYRALQKHTHHDHECYDQDGPFDDGDCSCGAIKTQKVIKEFEKFLGDYL
jgi:hypothetical protein